MKKRMKEVQDAASVLQRAIRDVPTKEFLEVEGRLQLENLTRLEHLLGSIGKCKNCSKVTPLHSERQDQSGSRQGCAPECHFGKSVLHTHCYRSVGTSTEISCPSKSAGCNGGSGAMASDRRHHEQLGIGFAH